MAKILNLVIQDSKDSEGSIKFVESFQLREDVENPEAALRSAIQDYVNSNTEESRKALYYACGCFNWGDVFSNVPESLFVKYGLTLLKQNSVDVFVDHDEILVDDSSDDPLQKIRFIIKGHMQKGERAIAYWADGDNPVAESMVETITLQNENLASLLALDEVSEDIITKLIEAEADDDMISIYENIRDSIADIAMFP